MIIELQTVQWEEHSVMYLLRPIPADQSVPGIHTTSCKVNTKNHWGIHDSRYIATYKIIDYCKTT